MANAFELMAKTMMEKALANLPPEVTDTIGQIGRIALSTKAQLDRIEERLIRIEAKLQIEQEPANVRSDGTEHIPAQD